MSVASRITSMTEHIQNAYDSIERFGVDTESIDKNLVNLSNTITNEIYDKLPKVSGNGSNFTLESVQKGKLDLFEMEGNTIQSELPSEYTQVDYIESNGQQYIDTGVNADSNLRVVLDIAYTNPTSSNQNIGAIILTPETLRYHLLSSPTVFKMYSYQSDVGVGNVDTNRHLFDFDIPNRKVYFDGNKFDKPSNDFDLGINFYLFGRNSTGSIYLSKVKQWACKMYYNNVLVRDFIPCYRNLDNEVGLYDLVNDVFYTNQGTGAFTYGALAPTPDAPVDIEVVNGEQTINIVGKNLFDKDNANVFTGYISGSNLTITTSGTNRSLYIECKPNTTYTIQKSIISENKFRVGTSNTVPTTSRTLEDANIADSSGSITLTTSANAHYLIVHFYNTASESTIEQALATIQIEKGNLATDWEAYRNQDYEIDLGDIELCKIGDYKDELVKSTGKNLFDSSLFGTFTKNTQFIELTLKPNTTYTLSSNIPTQSSNKSNANLFLLLENESPSSASNGVKPNVTRSKTTDSTGKLRIGYRDFDDEYDNEATIYWYQLEENSQATDYEPFGKVWYIKKEIGKVILDGSETWGISQVSGTILTNRFRASLGDGVPYLSYCDMFINRPQGSSVGDYEAILINNNNVYISVFISRLSENTINGFKNWLNSNNVTVYYVLNTPTYEEITNSTLINQLEAIETETGTNIFEVSNENNVLPSLNVKRLKELDKLS